MVASPRAFGEALALRGRGWAAAVTGAVGGALAGATVGSGGGRGRPVFTSQRML